jgi:hypothetical protein
LANFDLAGECCNRTVFTDVEPGRNFFRQLRRLNARAGSGFLSCKSFSGYGENRDASANDFEKITRARANWWSEGELNS